MAKNEKAKKPDDEPKATVRTIDGKEVSGPPNSIPGQPGIGVAIEEDNSGEMATAVLAPHLDDQRARPYIVHLPPTKRPGRREVRLDVRDVGAFPFRRGAGGDLEHVIRLTPPAARQLRTEGWIVLEKE